MSRVGEGLIDLIVVFEIRISEAEVFEEAAGAGGEVGAQVDAEELRLLYNSKTRDVYPF